MNGQEILNMVSEGNHRGGGEKLMDAVEAKGARKPRQSS